MEVKSTGQNREAIEKQEIELVKAANLLKIRHRFYSRLRLEFQHSSFQFRISSFQGYDEISAIRKGPC
jgi:hypothetical protein